MAGGGAVVFQRQGRLVTGWAHHRFQTLTQGGGAAADGWSVEGSHLVAEEIYIMGYAENVLSCLLQLFGSVFVAPWCETRMTWMKSSYFTTDLLLIEFLQVWWAD